MVEFVAPLNSKKHRLVPLIRQVEEGSLYPALQRLLKARRLKAAWGVSATNRRVRIYHITPAGRKHLSAEVSSYEQMLEGISLVLALGET